MSESTKDLKKEVRQLKKALREANKQINHWRRLELEAARYVELPICTRTHFTGNPPYVGWKGLGLALSEYMNNAEANLKELNRLKSQTRRQAVR